MNDELVELQIRLSHQENHMQELDKVIYQQQLQLDAMQKKLDLLEKYLRTLTESNILTMGEDKPPPHY